MPFIWELGLAPGYIVSSNALYYDPNTNVYFNNYLKPNKIQLNGVTALLFGFQMHKNEWQIGPQLQYGFTGFVNTNDGNPGHLFLCRTENFFYSGEKIISMQRSVLYFSQRQNPLYETESLAKLSYSLCVHSCIFVYRMHEGQNHQNI